MTVEGVYQLTLLLIHSTREDLYYRKMFIPAINMLLEETFVFNNSLRVAVKKPPLTQAMEIKDFEERVDCEMFLLKTILPYGAAGLLLFEDNSTMATIYKNRYEYLRNQVTFATYEQTMDCYGGGI